jgi:DNA processing protein
MQRQHLAAWLRLLSTPGVGNQSARQLLAAFGLPDAVLAQPETALAAVVGPARARALRTESDDLALLVSTAWEWLQADPGSRRVLTLADALYPQSLLNTEDPPPLLYAMGRPDIWSRNLLNSASCIAIVGSRNPSPQGTANARQFAHALAQAGLCVVSGMALGVDGAAHRGALEGADPDGLATIAVVGTGLDRIYPRQHQELAHRIAQRGLLLSELPLGTPPLSANFPQRNRIISGLSRGTLVVEAALLSGSLITARLAAEQGREVFAMPGSIHAPQSRGCHALIKQGAKLVESAQDVLEELQWGVGGTAPLFAPEAADPQNTPDLHTPDPDTPATHAGNNPQSKEASALLKALGYDPTGLDTLQARTGLPTAQLLAQLMELELQGLVARLPGGLFQRQQQA